MHIKCWTENPKERDNYQDLDADERIKYKWTLKEIGWGCVFWICLAQDREQWRGLVDTEPRSPEEVRHFLSS